MVYSLMTGYVHSTVKPPIMPLIKPHLLQNEVSFGWWRFHDGQVLQVPLQVHQCWDLLQHWLYQIGPQLRRGRGGRLKEKGEERLNCHITPLFQT